MVHPSSFLFAVLAMGFTSTSGLPTSYHLEARSPSPARVTTNSASGGGWNGAAAQQNAKLQAEINAAQQKVNQAKAQQQQVKNSLAQSYRQAEKQAASRFSVRSPSPAGVRYQTSQGGAGQWQGSAANANARLQAEIQDAQRKIQDAQRQQANMNSQMRQSYQEAEQRGAQLWKGRSFDEELESRDEPFDDYESISARDFLEGFELEVREPKAVKVDFAAAVAADKDARTAQIAQQQIADQARANAMRGGSGTITPGVYQFQENPAQLTNVVNKLTGVY